MQFLKLIFIIFFFSPVIYACEEAGTIRFRNNNNSVGGLIGPHAKVHPNAYIGFSAKVCEKAWVDELLPAKKLGLSDSEIIITRLEA